MGCQACRGAVCVGIVCLINDCLGIVFGVVAIIIGKKAAEENDEEYEISTLLLGMLILDGCGFVLDIMLIVCACKEWKWGFIVWFCTAVVRAIGFIAIAVLMLMNYYSDPWLIVSAVFMLVFAGFLCYYTYVVIKCWLELREKHKRQGSKGGESKEPNKSAGRQKESASADEE